MIKIAIKKSWLICPDCKKEQKILISNIAECSGVFLKCKYCKKEFEVVVIDGMQMICN